MSWEKTAVVPAVLYRSDGGAHELVGGEVLCLQPYHDHEGRETGMNRRAVLPTPIQFYETLVPGAPDVRRGDILVASGLSFVVRRTDLIGPTPNIKQFLRLGLEESYAMPGVVTRKQTVLDGMGGRSETWAGVWAGDLVLHTSYVGADMVLAIAKNRREAQKAPWRVELPADFGEGETLQELDRVQCMGFGIAIEVIGSFVGTDGRTWGVGVEL